MDEYNEWEQPEEIVPEVTDEPPQYNIQPNVQRSWTDVNQEPPGMAIASMILGIISVATSCVCIGSLTGVIAIVLGAVSRHDYPENGGYALAGIITGTIGTIISVLAILLFLFFMGFNFTAVYDI